MNIETYLSEIQSFESKDPKEIEAFRLKYLGKKGLFAGWSEELKALAPEKKRDFGQNLNKVKVAVQEKLKVLQKNATISKSKISLDYTLPATYRKKGSRHPISLVKERVLEIFSEIGYDIADGPEIEDDWHNFTALNMPDYHPARDMQDTFFLDAQKQNLLRTHTSTIQIRYMENNKPPIRVLAPGRVYRNETISARSHCMFHQIEGIYVDKNVSFADLKQTLYYFVKKLFGKTELRLRSSYFPFTEPSTEVDVYWGLETETDYRITKGTGWLEIMGCGMVDPNVLKNVGIDPTEYSGFAFGMGLERIAMLLYQITDIRDFYTNDVRFLSQFSSL